ncbi:hypothetical protein QL285_038989 [Trifolium repens]|nr:hypothetical protein QL285_038989 [Trifolium repens]
MQRPLQNDIQTLNPQFFTPRLPPTHLHQPIGNKHNQQAPIEKRKPSISVWLIHLYTRVSNGVFIAQIRWKKQKKEKERKIEGQILQMNNLRMKEIKLCKRDTEKLRLAGGGDKGYNDGGSYIQVQSMADLDMRGCFFLSNNTDSDSYLLYGEAKQMHTSNKQKITL